MKPILFLLVLCHLSLSLEGIDCGSGYLDGRGECSEIVSVINSNSSSPHQPVSQNATYLESNNENLTCEEIMGAQSIKGCKSLMPKFILENSFYMIIETQGMKDNQQVSWLLWVGGSLALAFVVLSLLLAVWCRYISKRSNWKGPTTTTTSL
ncbi:hypothetical protein UPYG_G00140120 [Umbra pygmaea]|uniref:Uncharacterized protein n=1 Tax=Umbra pygmaea TaxID=75934 RepID=A0ABD0WVD3_UMBPY